MAARPVGLGRNAPVSVQAITAALGIQSCTSGEKFLLVVLANYADQSMRCWPSQVRLGHDMSMTDRNVRRLFVSLQIKGLVSRERRPRRTDGTRTSAMITLHLHEDTMSSGHPEPKDTMSGNMRTPCPKHEDTMSSKPSLRTSKIEPSARECAQGSEDEALKAEVIQWAERFTGKKIR